MTYLPFIVSSLLPIFMLFAAWVLTLNKSVTIKAIFIAASLLFSAPLGALCVAISVGIDYDPSYEHSPGIGVAFIPLVGIWLLSILGTIIAFMVFLVLALLRSAKDNNRSR